MIKKTRWRPDTCGCDVEYEWDTEQNENNRVHTISQVFKKCNAHKDINNISNVFISIKDENQRKNVLYGMILKNISTATQEIIQDGKTVTKLKEGKDYKWSFDKNRKLVIELTGFSQAEKDTVQTIINGSVKCLNKVVIK